MKEPLPVRWLFTCTDQSTFSERLKQHATSMSLLFFFSQKDEMLLKFTPRASVLPSQPDRSTTLRSRPKKQSPTRTFCCQTPKHVHTAKRGHGLMEAHSAAPESAARFLSSKRLYAWQVTPQLLNPPHSTTAMTRTGPRPQPPATPL